MEESKNKFGIGILVGLLVAIIICLVGFIVYDKSMSNNNTQNSENGNNIQNNENENSEKITNLDLSSTLVTSLSEMFYGKYLTTDVSTYDNYFYKQDKTIIANVSDELKMIMVFRYLNHPGKISVSEYENAYRQIFGSDNRPVKLEETNDCYTNYVLVDGIYQHPELGGCGGAGGIKTYSKLVGAKNIVNNSLDKIVISEAVTFMVDNKLYNDSKHTEFVQDYEYVQGKNPLDTLNTSKFAQYDYTFTKDKSGVYVFTSVERVK